MSCRWSRKPRRPVRADLVRMVGGRVRAVGTCVESEKFDRPLFGCCEKKMTNGDLASLVLLRCRRLGLVPKSEVSLSLASAVVFIKG